MVTFDQFEEMTRDELARLPDYVQEELNGGVLVDSSAYLHPQRLADDLYILGTYSNSWLYGKQIVLYYGSFAATMNLQDEEAVRTQIASTLRHEFLHHMETRAGMFGQGSLIEEDQERMHRYYRMHAAQRSGIESWWEGGA